MIFRNFVALVFVQSIFQGYQAQQVPPDFLNFGPAVGDAQAPTNDDGATQAIPLDVLFPYFDNVHSELFVSTNGALSFLRQVSQFTPDNFPLGEDRRLITPFWADVDTRRGGSIYYGQASGTDPAALARRNAATSKINTLYGDTTFAAAWVFVATWYQVQCFGTCPSTNTFQAVLATDGSASYAIFIYDQITWTFGSASSGIHAVAGFNAGDGERFSQVPSSRTPEIADIEGESNVNKPGVWIFKVDSGTIQIAVCTNEPTGVLQSIPQYASILGGKIIIVSGPCFPVNAVVRCRFGNQVVEGRRINERSAECRSPFIGGPATVTLAVSINGGNFGFSTPFYFVEYDPTREAVRRPTAGWEGLPGPPPLLEWDPADLSTQNVDIFFVGFRAEADGTVTNDEFLIASNVPNTPDTGNVKRFSFSSGILNNIIPIVPRPGAIKIIPSGTVDAFTECLWSDLHYPRWYWRQLFVYVARQNQAVRKKRFLRELGEVWNAIRDTIGNVVADIEQVVDRFIDELIDDFSTAACRAWVAYENRNPANFGGVLPPPCNLRQALNDPRFIPDPACNMGDGCRFHPGAHHCVRQRIPSRSGASQQACYSQAGDLLPFNNGGGTLDRFGVRNTNLVTLAASAIGHFTHDVQSYFTCCVFSNNCDLYEGKRPTQDCGDYRPPGRGFGFGDPHILTLDGFAYTFNGLGEYWLIRSANPGFSLQGRTTQVSQGTQFAAAAMQMGATGQQVHVELNDLRGLDVYVDRVLQGFIENVLTEISFDGGTATWSKDTQDRITVVVSFTVGISVEIVKSSMTHISLSPSMDPMFRDVATVEGLYGNFNGDQTDDLRSPTGQMLSATASQQMIFGHMNQWRVTPTESLFYYRLTQTHASFNVENFMPAFPTQAQLNDPSVLAVCGQGNPQCQFDFVVTGDTSFALDTLQNTDVAETIMQNIQPVVTCGFPDSPPNSVLSTTASGVGTVVQFSCATDFLLQGVTSIECLASGVWSAPAPSCLLQSLRCDISGFPTSNPYPTGVSNDVGAVVVFMCQSGFRLQGERTLTCQEDGFWSGQPPTCIVANCPVLSNPENGMVSGTDTAVGTVRTFSCQAGYVLQGPTLITCDSNGNWSIEPPTCEGVCPYPTFSANLIVTRQNNVGGITTFACLGGLTLEGASSMRCQADGTWTARPPVCRGAVNCPPLVTPLNSFVSTSSNAEGAVVTYTCREGFVLQGASSITCGTDGVWTAQTPLCIALSCVFPGNPSNGFVNGRRNDVGAVLQFNCRLGYTLQGPSTITCMSDGTWSGPTPLCIQNTGTGTGTGFGTGGTGVGGVGREETGNADDRRTIALAVGLGVGGFVILAAIGFALYRFAPFSAGRLGPPVPRGYPKAASLPGAYFNGGAHSGMYLNTSAPYGSGYFYPNSLY